MKNRQLRLDIGVGAIYNNKKLVATKHVGSMMINENSFDINQEVEMLSCGPELALPCDAIGTMYEELAPIQSRIGKPDNIICFIMKVVDYRTGKKVKSICEKVNKAQNHVNTYIEKGYDMKSFEQVYDDIKMYELNEETMEELNLLEVKADKFDLVGMIDTVKEGLADEIDEEDMIKDLRRSKLVDYIFVASEVTDGSTQDLVKRVVENDGKIYVPFATISRWNMEVASDVVVLAEGEFGESCEGSIPLEEHHEYLTPMYMGSLDLCEGIDIGILVECRNKVLTFKGVNYIYETPAGQSLVQVVEDMGMFIDVLCDFINQFEMI